MRLLPMAAVFALIFAFAVPGTTQGTHAGPLTALCMNPEVGYTVNFPNNWFYNTHVEGGAAADIAACVAFSPDDFDLTPGSEPSGIAIFISESNQAFDESVGEPITVGGRDAVRYESENTAPGFEGMYYIYSIDLGDGTTLTAQTSDRWVGPYEENKDILDGMMASLEFVTPTERHGGADRYHTAALVSAANFEPGVDMVYIATGTRFPDALAGTPAAAVDGGPILLVTPNGIPAATAGELARLQPGAIAVLGGPEAISNSVVNSLGAYTAGEVFRLAGADRYATAAAVSAATFTSGGVAYVATGQAYPDALTGGALAGTAPGPVLLVRHGDIPAATAAELTRLSPAAIVILGGTEAVSGSVAAQLDAYTSGDLYRIAGTDRYGTAALVSQWSYEPGVDAVYVATGVEFPDALAGGPAAVLDGAPILLVRPNAVPQATADELERLDPERVVILGGPNAVSPAVEIAVAAHAAR